MSFSNLITAISLKMMAHIKPLIPAAYSKKTLYFGILVFIFVAAWMVLLTQGLPFFDGDDWDHVLISADTPWKTVVTNFITPWPTSKYWVSQGSIADQVRNKRVFLGLTLKFITHFFGYNIFLYYFFSKVLFFSGTVTLVFLILTLSLNGSYRYAIVGTVFYLLVPANYLHVLWISASETAAHFFILLSVYLFLHLAKSFGRKFQSRDWWTLFSLFVTGWFAMKTKESAVILPLTLFAFTLFHTKRNSSYKEQWLVVLFVLLYILFLVVPVSNLGQRMPGEAYNWKILIRLFLRNYDCGYDDEPRSAFFSLDHIWPVSIARTIGFPLLWSIVFLVLIYVFNKLVRKCKYKNLILFFENDVIQISVFWTLIELFLFGFFQPDPRYFSGTMIPITILISRLVYCVAHQFQKSWVKTILVMFVVGTVLWALIENFQHTIWRRRQMGQTGNAYTNVAQVIYEDQFPSQSYTLRDLGLYYCPTYAPDRSRPRMIHVTYYVGLGYTLWSKGNGSMRTYDEFAKEGKIYYATDLPDKIMRNENVKLLAVLPRVNESSWFERFLYQLKKKSPAPFYVFKHQ